MSAVFHKTTFSFILIEGETTSGICGTGIFGIAVKFLELKWNFWNLSGIFWNLSGIFWNLSGI